MIFTLPPALSSPVCVGVPSLPNAMLAPATGTAPFTGTWKFCPNCESNSEQPKALAIWNQIATSPPCEGTMRAALATRSLPSGVSALTSNVFAAPPFSL